MSNMSGKDHEDLTTNFDCIYCQFFFFFCENQIHSWFFYLFILTILVGLHNTHVLNYTRNIFKRNCIPNTRKHFQAHF